MKITLVFLFTAFFVSSLVAQEPPPGSGGKPLENVPPLSNAVEATKPMEQLDLQPDAQPDLQPKPVDADTGKSKLVVTDVVEPKPVKSGVVEPKPVKSGVVEPKPVKSGVVEPKPVKSGVVEPKPVKSGVQPKPSASPKADLEKTVYVYAYDSDREDCTKAALEPWDVQKILEEKNVTVLSSQKGYDGLIYSVDEWGCRTYPPRINIFSIPTPFYEAIKGMGFHLCKELEKGGGGCHPVLYSEILSGKRNNKFYVHIYKHSKRILCEPNSGMRIEKMEEELIEAKIVVYHHYRAFDGLHHPLTCGESTGDINVYVIEKAGLAKSVSMGYRECAWLQIKGGKCHPLSD